jgi:glycerol-3-phosphate dehydrogenase (NAD(P)+)
MDKHKIALLGAGSWGTAVALHLAKHHEVLLWGHLPSHIEALNKDRENKQFLAGYHFPDSLTASNDLSACLNQAHTVIIAVPSHAFAEVFDQIDKISGPITSGISWITKGIDPDTNTLLSQIVASRWGHNHPMATLSGPSFAKEVARGLPTAITLASNDEAYGNALQQLFCDPQFRVYLSDDMTGVQLCGAVKNVLAIATGISDGLGFGANARAALITRGLAEMTRLGSALGAKQHTFSGLAGLGDLVLTCTDDQSRNRRFGLAIGQGQQTHSAEKSIGQVVEGKHNAYQVCHLANQHQISMPICQTIKQILEGNTTAQQAVHQLMTRPLKHE